MTVHPSALRGTTIRARLAGRAAVHRIRADQLEPDERFGGDFLRPVSELIAAVAACGRHGTGWLEASDRDTEPCLVCEGIA